MTQNPIEILKASIYTSKHPQNTKIHFKFSELSKSMFPPKYVQNNQRFMLICMALFIICICLYILYMLRATQPN